MWSPSIHNADVKASQTRRFDGAGWFSQCTFFFFHYVQPASLHSLTPECWSHTRLTKQDIISIREATWADYRERWWSDHLETQLASSPSAAEVSGSIAFWWTPFARRTSETRRNFKPRPLSVRIVVGHFPQTIWDSVCISPCEGKNVTTATCSAECEEDPSKTWRAEQFLSLRRQSSVTGGINRKLLTFRDMWLNVLLQRWDWTCLITVRHFS